MSTKLMIGVEYYNTDNTNPLDEDATTTFNIFESIEDAWTFTKEKNINAISMFIADFNKHCIFKEEGGWNYDDVSSLFNKKMMLFGELS